MKKRIAKRNIPFVMAIVFVLALGLVSAGDFKINYGGNDIFTVATSGNVNASGTLAESGVLLSETYLALAGGALTGILSSDSNITTSAFVVGDGTYLKNANITITDNSTEITYKNITDIPTCSNTERLNFDGTTLSCTAFDNTNIAYYNETITWAGAQQFSANINITGNITDSNYINADYFVGAGSKLTDLPADMAVIKYQNISNLPTCGAGEHLDYDGSELTCTADSGGTYASLDTLNVAFTNRTNTFTGQQVFDEDLNLSTASIVFKDNDSSITRAGQETTNITIDSLGNVIIQLG